MNTGAIDLSELEICHRSVVMPWQCDDMGHLNIRFYIARYREALRHKAAFAPRFQGWPHPLFDRVVFEKEVRVGARVACSLGLTGFALENEPMVAVGCLWDMTSGDVLARFTTIFKSEESLEKPAVGDKIDLTWLGQSVEPAWSSAMGVFPVVANDCLETAEHMTAVVSDANALAVLELSKGSDYEMDNSPIGFVVAELVFAYSNTHLPETRAYSASSSVLAHSRRSVTFQHRILMEGAAAEVTSVRSTCVFFDRQTRKAVPIPFGL